jgi:hypothetical protein
MNYAAVLFLVRMMQDRQGLRRCQVSKTGLFEPFIYINEFYQDRLGTNIGKTQKKDRFAAALPMPPSSLLTISSVRENGPSLYHPTQFP